MKTLTTVNKKYTVYVYKFGSLDEKNITRIKMIELWIKELELKGCFILSDTENKMNVLRIGLDKQKQLDQKPGYLIIGGELITSAHNEKLSDLMVFQKRFECLHWKKSKMYNYLNNEFISSIDYNNIPNEFLRTSIDKTKSDKTHNYDELLKIIQNI